MAKQPTIVGVILGTNYSIMGFQMDAGAGMVPVTLASLREKGFHNRQVDISKSKFALSRRDVFWGMNLFMLTPTGEIIPSADNSMTLTARIVNKATENVDGYYVRICGREEPMRVEDVIRISGWVKPSNFVVRTDLAENGRPAKRFLAAKPNMPSLSELPAYTTGNSRGTEEDSKRGAVPAPTAATNKKVVAKPGAELGHMDLDIETVYAKVAELGGMIAMAPDEEYKQSGAKKQKASKFVSIGAPEVASPKLGYNETKLNANSNFRKLGQLNLPADAPMRTADVFMWKTRHLFYNGHNYMDELRVFIPKDRAEEFMALNNKDFAIRPVAATEKSAKGSAWQGDPCGVAHMQEFAIRLNKLEIIGFPHPGNEAILPTKTLYELVYQMLYIKTVKKVLNAKLKVLLKDDPSVKRKADGNKVCPMYAGLSAEQLDYLQGMGVNIADGSYNPSADDIDEIDKDGSESLGGATAIEIDYNLVGFGDKELGGDAKYNVTTAAVEQARQYLQNAADYIENESDLVVQYAKTKKIIDDLDVSLSEAKHALWRHKTAMVLKNKGTVHQHDRTSWAPKATKKAGAIAYQCSDPECPGLTMTVIGTKI